MWTTPKACNRGKGKWLSAVEKASWDKDVDVFFQPNTWNNTFLPCFISGKKKGWLVNIETKIRQKSSPLSVIISARSFSSNSSFLQIGMSFLHLKVLIILSVKMKWTKLRLSSLLQMSSIFSICNFHFNIMYIVLHCILSFCFEAFKILMAWLVKWLTTGCGLESCCSHINFFSPLFWERENYTKCFLLIQSLTFANQVA